MKKTQEKFKILRPSNALSLFLLLVIISIVVFYLLMFLNDNYGFDGSEPSPVGNYEVYVSIESSKDVDISQFGKDMQYNLSNKNTVLGFVKEARANGNGGYTVTFLVKGTYTEADGFKLNGAIPLSSGEILDIHNRTDLILTAEVKVIKAIKAGE